MRGVLDGFTIMLTILVRTRTGRVAPGVVIVVYCKEEVLAGHG